MKKKITQQVINQMILEKMGNSDEFIEEVQQESKPSRIESRRQRSEQYEQKKRNRKHFNEYDD